MTKTNMPWQGFKNIDQKFVYAVAPDTTPEHGFHIFEFQVPKAQEAKQVKHPDNSLLYITENVQIAVGGQYQWIWSFKPEQKQQVEHLESNVELLTNGALDPNMSFVFDYDNNIITGTQRPYDEWVKPGVWSDASHVLTTWLPYTSRSLAPCTMTCLMHTDVFAWNKQVTYLTSGSSTSLPIIKDSTDRYVTVVTGNGTLNSKPIEAGKSYHLTSKPGKLKALSERMDVIFHQRVADDYAFTRLGITNPKEEV